jgi:hypothetical protein
MSHRALGLTLLWVSTFALVVFFLGQAMTPDAALYSRVLSPRAIDWIGAIPKVVLPGLAAFVAWGVARKFEPRNPARLAWALFAFGLFGLFLGQVMLASFFAQGKGDVFPSIGDLFFVVGSIAVVVALAAFVRAYAASGFPIGPRRQLWGIGIAAAVLSAALVVPILWPVVEAPAAPLEKALNLAYPSFDFLMLIPALLLFWITLRFRGGRLARVWTALLAGILFTAAGDILFGYFSNLGQTNLGAVIDAVYILAYGCLAASVLYQRDILAG